VNELLRKILMLPEQASTIARDIDALHYFVIITTMVGAIGVALFTLYYIVRYGQPMGSKPQEHAAVSQARRSKATWLELTAVVGLLTLFVMWWVIGFRQFVQLAEPPPDSMTIYATGKKWMWSFAYPEGGGSEGVLYVPTRQPVKLVMTSRDVIHSFYVPAFRVKKDVLPGRSTTVWFEVDHPGHYPIYCAEYCGMGHSTMLAEVVALDGDAYQRQVDGLEPVQIAGPIQQEPSSPGHAAPATPLSLAAMGAQVAANAGCLRCHTVDGTPHVGPTWAGLYDAEIPLQSGKRVIADEGYLTRSMMDPDVEIHAGFPAVMPTYQGLLAAPQIGAIVEYIRALQNEPRHVGAAPLPASVDTPVPLVTPLRGDRAPKPGEPADSVAPPRHQPPAFLPGGARE
jgi:cytochrome c oxidase subunit 2